MNAVSAADLEAVVTPAGDLVVPARELRELALIPGQRVHLRLVKPKRRNMRGVLAGRVPSITAEEIDQVRRETWGESDLGPR